MLYLSFLFILAGTSGITTAIVAITYILLTSPEKITYLEPKKWPDNLKRWSVIAGAGLACSLLGMLWAALAT